VGEGRRLAHGRGAFWDAEEASAPRIVWSTAGRLRCSA
jgi:hypothetical protein